ncbi:GPN-loop GTPase 3 [Neoconidiobolus thromboides FSU 785]|nr:GPN-loop GTPase 3 [Neoconidiobolus thromboides FSU 785]
MGRYVQLVMGPAGSGKSTYCKTMINHLITHKRTAHLVNLDPAAEDFEFEPTIDIRDLISLEDVMEELNYGPNGGLIYCLEFLLSNIDWFEDELGDYEDDYLIIDCPGQIELYTHFPIMSKLCEMLQKWNFKICGIYLLESQFVEDKSKFFAGVLSALSAMVNLEIPHINVFSKMDLVADKTGWERFINPDPYLIDETMDESEDPKFFNLNKAIGQLIDDHSLVSFLPLDITSEDSIAAILSHADNAIQYGEDQEPNEPDFAEGEEEEE